MMYVFKNMIRIAKLALCCVLLSACFITSGAESEKESRGMFSWKSDVFEDGGSELFLFMKQHGFTELYQWFSRDLEDKAITGFLQNAQKEGIALYMLTGDPIWANDAGGREQLKAVNEVVRINKLTASGAIKGIVFDIEPYLLDKWENNAEKIMERFISGMKNTYTAAMSKNLEIVLCVPFYYDNMELKGELEKLIQRGCDRVAIMNYFKESEASNIEREVKYALRHEKGIIHIYEFKSPGQHGLREINTYYADGFEAAISSFDVIKEAFPDSGITMAAHDYEALQEVLVEDE